MQKLSDVAERYDKCINGFDQLVKWIDYIETKAECDNYGLADFTEKIVAMDNQIADVSDAFEKGAEFLRNIKEEKPHTYGMVGYLVKNTITENGRVKRGVCEVEDGFLNSLIESSVGRTEEGNITAKPLDETIPEFDVSEDDTVSMNMLLFNPSIFDYIESKFEGFLVKNNDNLEKCEFLIPDVLFESIDENFATCTVIPTTATWYGVTYKEDTPKVKDALKEMTENGTYHKNLWQ